MNTLVVIIIVLAFVLIFATIIGRLLAARRKQNQLLEEGELGVARVVTISQTGTTINRVPEMQLVLDIERGGEQPRRTTIRQLVDIGVMPRAGERVYVLVDPKNPANVMMSPTPSGAGIKVPTNQAEANAPQEVDLGSDATRDIFALSPRLREHGQLGIAKVVSISPTNTSASQITLDVESIAKPPRRLTITQIVDGEPPSVGERIYILVDPGAHDSAALVPLSMTQGRKIPITPNRLDPIVLGPQILREGAKANGLVRSAIQQPMDNPLLASKGATKWALVLNVTPEGGSPAYEATLIIGLSNAEKAAKVAYSGAQVPLRYDPLDPQTVAIDSLAMGYGDPYEAVREMLKR